MRSYHPAKIPKIWIFFTVHSRKNQIFRIFAGWLECNLSLFLNYFNFTSMWEEFWVNSLKCLFCYQSSGAFSFKSSVNFFHLIFSKPKTKEQIWKGNVIHELILQTKNHSCNNSMVYCSWHYSRLAIKNLTPWLHKVDPNFLAGICGVIPILRLQALENKE